MNAETRAKELCNALHEAAKLKGESERWALARALIAAALTSAVEETGISARRQALEEAAQICKAHLKLWGDEPRCSPEVLAQAAREIRSLKGVDYTAILSLPKKD